MKNCLLVLVLALIASPLFAQQSVPEIPFDSVPDFLKLPPGMNFGEVPGVAVNSKGHVFVFTRSNSAQRSGVRRPRRRSCSSSVPRASSCAKSARASTPGPKPTPCASTRTTTSGPSTKAPTW